MQAAGKELIHFLSERPQVEELVTAVVGYDIPPFLSMADFKVWSEVEPPKGTIYNYPVRPWHNAELLHDRLVRPAGYRGADVEPRHHSHDGVEAGVRADH